MGIIFAKFRKKLSTKEILREIQDNIDYIEEFKLHTQQRQKWLVGNLVAYSIILYLISAVTSYFYFMPKSIHDAILYCIPFIIFPIIRKITKNEKKMHELKEKKKKILDEVMETETYKVAKEILEEYAPGHLKVKMNNYSSTTAPVRAPVQSVTTPVITSAGGVRRRISPKSSEHFSLSHLPSKLSPNSNISAPLGYQLRTPENIHAPPAGPPMPRPLLPRERGFLDRFVEYLVGDGPSNRYALICRQCESHNGMALKDEFEYVDAESATSVPLADSSTDDVEEVSSPKNVPQKCSSQKKIPEGAMSKESYQQSCDEEQSVVDVVGML